MSKKTPFKFTISKKGSAFGQLWQAAIGLGIFILVVVLVAMMTQEVYDVADDNPDLEVITNDSTVFAGGFGQTDNYPIHAQITQCANNTAVLTVPGQCNISTAANGTIQAVSTLVEGSTLNISYTCERDSAAKNATSEGLTAIQLLSEWQTIVVIAVVMIVLIGLILKEFGYLG